jgi:hypothetical protein
MSVSQSQSCRRNTMWLITMRFAEAVAAHIMQVAKDGDTNVADLLTKPLTEQRRTTLLRSILYNL